jgi:hypothetical protein
MVTLRPETDPMEWGDDPPLGRVISGAQTGVDQAGLRAAKRFNIPTGGSMPKGYLTEDGPRPEFAEMYGVVELDSTDYPTQTRRNIEDADATIWFDDWRSWGGRMTIDHCRMVGRPFFVVMPMVTQPVRVADWIRETGVRVLNVAGDRESKSPGIGDRAEAFLARVFRRMTGADSGIGPGRGPSQ